MVVKKINKDPNMAASAFIHLLKATADIIIAVIITVDI